MCEEQLGPTSFRVQDNGQTGKEIITGAAAGMEWSVGEGESDSQLCENMQVGSALCDNLSCVLWCVQPVSPACLLLFCFRWSQTAVQSPDVEKKEDFVV